MIAKNHQTNFSKNPDFHNYFYGSTTLGKKGQIVIPVEARQKLNLKEGEKMLVFGLGKDMLCLVKLINIEKIAHRLAKRLKIIKEIIRKSK